MKRVKDLISEYDDLDLYSKYGMVNILCDLYSKMNSRKECYLLLHDSDFLNYDVTFDDLCNIIKQYQNKMYYEINTVTNDITYFEFSPQKNKGDIDKGGHVISTYMTFEKTYEKTNEFLKSNGKDGKMSKSISPSITKNVNPFVSEYQTVDMYMIASNIVSTITTKKFNPNYFSVLIPDLGLESLFYYFEIVQNQHNNKPFLNNEGKVNRGGELRPNHHFCNYKERINWFIKEGGIIKNTDEIKHFNMILFISEEINKVQNKSYYFENFKKDLLNCEWYWYGEEFKKFKFDYSLTKVIYDNYKNTHEYFQDFRGKDNRYVVYTSLVKFLKSPTYRNMDNILQYGLAFKESNKIVNEYKNKLNVNYMINEVTLLGKRISDNSYKIFKDRYDKPSDKDMLYSKISNLKAEISRNVKKSKNILDLFEYFAKLSSKYKMSFINISIENYVDISEEDFEKMKQLIVISIHTKYDYIKKDDILVENQGIFEDIEEVNQKVNLL